MTTRYIPTLVALIFLTGTAHGENTPAIANTLARTVSFVTVTRIANQNGAGKLRMPNYPAGTPFDELFKDFIQRHGGPSKQVTNGNGITIDSSGLILVPKGCVPDAYQIQVTLQDGTVHEAAIVDQDSYEQVELIRINVAGPLPFATLGNSSELRQGDPVITVANPLGNGTVILNGVVAPPVPQQGAGPILPNTTWTEGAIPAAGPGGFLFNAKGEVIGQNYLRLKLPGTSRIIGGALPSDLLKPAFASRSEGLFAHRGWTGLHFGAQQNPGALIDEVVPASPAFRAGVRPGDVIIRASDEDVKDVHHFLKLMSTKMVGDEVHFTVQRGQASVDLALVAGELPLEAKVVPKPRLISGKDTLQEFGVSVSALTDQLRAQFNLSASTKGAVIVNVTSGPAASRGLRPGDVIIEADHRDVITPDDLITQIEAGRAANRKSVFLLIESDGAHRYVTLPFDT